MSPKRPHPGARALSPSPTKAVKTPTSTKAAESRSAAKAAALEAQESRLAARVDKAATPAKAKTPAKTPAAKSVAKSAAKSTAKKPAATPKAPATAPSSVRRRRSVAPSADKSASSDEEPPAVEAVPLSKASAYATAMANYPLLANGTQAAVINAAAVLTAQVIKAKGIPESFDWADVGIFMVIGAFVVTPLILCVLIGRVFRLGLTKGPLLVASTLFGMFLVNAAFHVSFGVLYQLLGAQGKGVAGVDLPLIVAGLFTRAFLGGALKSRVVFFPADVANTFVVPQLYQPLVGNVAGFVYTVGLALSLAA